MSYDVSIKIEALGLPPMIPPSEAFGVLKEHYRDCDSCAPEGEASELDMFNDVGSEFWVDAVVSYCEDNDHYHLYTEKQAKKAVRMIEELANYDELAYWTHQSKVGYIVVAKSY